jgi:hypothetical protein
MEMWCWVIINEDGSEEPITSTLPECGPAPVYLQHRHREVAERWRLLAMGHGRITGQTVRLAHLVESKVKEEVA